MLAPQQTIIRASANLRCEGASPPCYLAQNRAEIFLYFERLVRKGSADGLLYALCLINQVEESYAKQMKQQTPQTRQHFLAISLTHHSIMNNVQKHIIEEIRCRYGRVDSVLPAGWHFMFNQRHYLFLPSPRADMARICIPHLALRRGCGVAQLSDAVNATNRSVRFVKAMTLENGAVAINYDFHVFENHCVGEVVARVVQALDYAAGFFEERVNGEKVP